MPPRPNLPTKRKPRKIVSNEDRKSIIEEVAIEGAINQAMAARRHGLSTATVSRIMNVWYKEGRMERKIKIDKRREENLNLFDDVHAKFITTLLDKDCTTTLDMAKEKLKAEFPDLDEKNISTRALWQFIREHIGFTLKRIKATESQNTQAVIDQRYDYVMNKGLSYQSNCIFVDEADFHSNIIRAPLDKKGKKKIVSYATKQTIYLSVLVGISYYGLNNVVVENVQGGNSGQTIKDFISGILNELNDKNAGSHVIVIDHTLIDKSPAIEELFAHSIHQLCLLPPNSPFLNPVEECFSQLKTYVKRIPNMKSSRQLSQHVEKSVYEASKKNSKKWITRSISFCIDKD